MATSLLQTKAWMDLDRMRRDQYWDAEYPHSGQNGQYFLPCVERAKL